MTPVFKTLTHDWLPPALIRRVQKQRTGGLLFEGNFLSWDDARAHCSGYDAKDILAKVLDATLKVKVGEAVFERDSVLFDKIEVAWPVLAGLMWAAARNEGNLNVLDFGGALGSTFFQNQEFLQPLTQVRWSVVEQAHYVEAGKTSVQDNQLRFYGSIEGCLAENQPSVILLSSVLQYLKSPFEIIKKLSRAGADCMIIDRTPFSTNDKGRLMIQHVPPSIYDASYPIWVFSYSELLKELSFDWRLIASSMSPEGCVKSNDGFVFRFQGLLLESR